MMKTPTLVAGIRTGDRDLYNVYLRPTFDGSSLTGELHRNGVKADYDLHFREENGRLKAETFFDDKEVQVAVTVGKDDHKVAAVLLSEPIKPYPYSRPLHEPVNLRYATGISSVDKSGAELTLHNTIGLGIAERAQVIKKDPFDPGEAHEIIPKRGGGIPF